MEEIDGSITQRNKAMVKMAQVMLDLLTDQADDQTIKIAESLQWECPELWRETPWLRMVGGTAPGSMNNGWVAYLRDEMEDEFNEED